MRSEITPARRTAAERATPSRRIRPEQRAPYLFIAPFYVLFGVFFLGPSVFALVLSLFRWNAVGTTRWAGVSNYARMFADPVFWQAMGNTAIYMLASLFWVCPLALLLALALNAPLVRFKSLWRAMYFSPIVTSTVAITIVFILLYNRDYGLINVPLRSLGLPGVNWLGDSLWVKFAIIGLLTWRWTGLTMISFLAGLQSIPQEFYEAAAIDGADSFQSFWHITLPMLRPVILFVSVSVLIGSAQIFEEPFILTGGGPANASISIAQYLYGRGITRLEFGYASAVGCLLFVLIFGLSALQFRWLGIFRDV